MPNETKTTAISLALFVTHDEQRTSQEALDNTIECIQRGFAGLPEKDFTVEIRASQIEDEEEAQ